MTGAADWQARVGDVWAAEWRRTDRSFGGLDPHLVAAILERAPQSGRALDIGCGAGATSVAVAEARPGLSITAIDLSAALVSVARERLVDQPQVECFIGDALDAGSPEPFDLLYSRHGVMFFADPVTAFTRLRAMARPGAALVFSCFRDRALNAWATEPAAALGSAPVPPTRGTVAIEPGPFAFATEAQVTAMLDAAGWRAVEARPIDYAYRAGAGADPVADAVAFLSRIGPAASMLAAAPDDERADLLDRLAQVCAARRIDDVIDFPAAAWLWSARA